MSVTRHLYAVVTLVAATTTAVWAQPAPAAGASAPAADCVKPMHDHGAEKGTPMAHKHCAESVAPAASAAGAKAKSKPIHDHGKVHKNQ